MTSQSIPEIYRERQLRDVSRDCCNARIKQYWTIFKRLSLIGLVGYYACKSENRQTLKSYLKSASAPIEQKVKELKDGMKFLNDTLTPQNAQEAEKFRQRQQKQIQELRKEGMQDPNFRYAEHGTKEAREAMEFYRKEGVFKD